MKSRRKSNVSLAATTAAKTFVFMASLAPLLLLFWRAYADKLGANPIEFITHSTGIWTLVFLLLTLTITPLRKVSGCNELIKFRRMLGLFAFFYASLHLTTYVALDQFFDGAAILEDIVKRPYVTAGFVGFVLLVPLAVTSTRRMIALLGHRWRLLHRLVYVSAAAGVVHFLWLVKADLREPIVYAGIFAVLMGYRLLLMLDWKKLKSVNPFDLRRDRLTAESSKRSGRAVGGKTCYARLSPLFLSGNAHGEIWSARRSRKSHS